MDEMDDELREKAIKIYLRWKCGREERKCLRKSIIQMIARCGNVSLHELIEEESLRKNENREKLKQKEVHNSLC